MRGVARLDRDVELGALGRHVEEQAAVVDFQDVRAELAEPRGDHAEHARPVRNGQAERHDAALALELAHHDRGENARIDVAAAQDQPDLAAGEALRVCQQRREPGRARAFRHGLLMRQEGVHGALQMGLLDQQHVGDERAHDRLGEPADILHRDALGERRRRRPGGSWPFSAFHIEG